MASPDPYRSTLPPDVVADGSAQWTQLHELIAAQVCPASRQTAPDPVSLDRALRDLPHSLRAQLRATLRRCATHDEEGGCPLAAEPRARLLGCSDMSAVH